MAVEATLLLQGKINDEDDDTITMRLLVSSKVIGCIIGKSGSIINEIRKRTKAEIRISKGQKPKVLIQVRNLLRFASSLCVLFLFNFYLVNVPYSSFLTS